MTWGKRLFDLSLLALSLPFTLSAAFTIALLCAVMQGRPILFSQVRVRECGRSFCLWKFRTMTLEHRDRGVSGGDKARRVTRLGRALRRFHLDELPQLWNILQGEMSFVGPRPPLPPYVLAEPKLYGQVLSMRPGLTGLATCIYGPVEVVLLSQCKTAEETEAVYRRRCIPRKARLDLIYLKRRSIGLDLKILFHSVTGRPWRGGHAVAALPAATLEQAGTRRLPNAGRAPRPSGQRLGQPRPPPVR